MHYEIIVVSDQIQNVNTDVWDTNVTGTMKIIFDKFILLQWPNKLVFIEVYTGYKRIHCQRLNNEVKNLSS